MNGVRVSNKTMHILQKILWSQSIYNMLILITPYGSFYLPLIILMATCANLLACDAGHPLHHDLMW